MTTYAAPNAASILSPTGSAIVDFAFIQRLSWIYSNADPTDTQSAFDIQYRVVGAGSWTTISASTPNNFYDLPAGTLTANNYEWQVRTYDAIGIVGPWCASSFFTASTAPADPAITTPTSGATVSANVTFTWSAPAQTDYQVRKVRDVGGTPDTTTIYYDSGDVISSSIRSVILLMPTNNRYEHLQVRIKNAGSWSNWVSVRVLASYIQPSPGTLAIVVDDPNAAITITTTAAAVGGGEPTPIYIEIFIKEVGAAGYGDCYSPKIAPTGVWIWHAPAHGIPYEIRSLTTGDNGAQRWSSAVFAHIFDGGPAIPAAWTIKLDGGNASTVFTNVVDGGTP
jgi:hypothetical protein